MTGSPWNARWTTARDDQLRAMVGEGMSAGQIAIELGGGLTRNAVIGRMGRISLKSHNAPYRSSGFRAPNGQAGGIVASIKRSHKASASDRAADRGVTQKVNAKANGTAAPILPQRVDASLAEFNAAIGKDQRKTLVELDNNSCRWPINDGPDYLFCGAPEADMACRTPYCGFHSRIAGAGYTRERGYGFQRSVNSFR